MRSLKAVGAGETRREIRGVGARAIRLVGDLEA